MRKKFYSYLNKLFSEDIRIALLLGDIGYYSFRNLFNIKPTRAYNLGIMEQTMVGVASGLSKSGFIPIIHSIAPFITERCYEQIKMNLGYEKENCFIVSVGNSYDYSALGVSHHCPNDLGIMTKIPNMATFCPGNMKDVENIFENELNTKYPKYIRLSEIENNYTECSPLQNRELKFLSKGQDGCILVVGNSVLNIEELLSEFSNLTVVYTYSISGFRADLLNKYMESTSTKKVITVIEPATDSGLLTHLALSIPNMTELHSISIPKGFIDKYGSKDQIDKHLKLDQSSILHRLKKIYDC